MKVSILGPTNMEKFCMLIGKSIDEIESLAKTIGKVLAQANYQVVMVFNYSGILRMIGESYKENGGKLEMLYTENNYDWGTDVYMKYLEEANIKTKTDCWHDLLLSLVKDVDLVICAGLSSGVLVELGYMKWNYQHNRGGPKALIGIEELLRNKEFPPELSFNLNKFMIISSIKNFQKYLKGLSNKI
ncbi:MAG: hypothetical protein QMD14_03515 [Candidatus Aenigmarchaeota archaeon]|nr:hypothetical protein [Candidatus Aenigmarchaeota archaeon]